MYLIAIPFLQNKKQAFFNGKMIDSHAHVGFFYSNPLEGKMENYTLDNLSDVVSLKNNPDLEKILVSNLSCISNKNAGQKGSEAFLDEYTGNKQLLQDCKKYHHFLPLAVAQPNPNSKNAINLRKLLSEFPTEFYGIKLHPDYLNLDAHHPAYDAHLKLAEQYKLPVVIHTAPGPSSPEKIYELGRRHPKVPIVLYHMNLAPGMAISELSDSEKKLRGLEKTPYQYCWQVRENWNREGIDVVEKALLKKDANLFIEVSWTKSSTVVEAIKRLGADRVIWGSDAPFLETKNDGSQVPYNERLQDVKQAIHNVFGEDASQIIDKVFYQNSKKLFFDTKKSEHSPFELIDMSLTQFFNYLRKMVS
jgi:predicted TIM-barrel fold metal-dependent hydrolase